MKALQANSLEASWAAKTVHASRPVAIGPANLWHLEGKGKLSFTRDSGAPAVRVDAALDNRSGLPNATARRAIANEDWRNYNRLAFWVRTRAAGLPMLTLMVTIRNASMDGVDEVHARESTQQVSVPQGQWTLVHWEIPHVRRDRVTSVDFRPWINKILSDPWDTAAYEIRSIELQKVDADHYEGWNVAPGKIAFSHTGYRDSINRTASSPAIPTSSRSA